jgi:hypothetical protein
MSHDKRFQVFVIDNFHGPDADACSGPIAFESHAAAVRYCKRIVDDFLADSLRPGMTAEALWSDYATFGEDPVVTGDASFSGWDYARQRCAELCGREGG